MEELLVIDVFSQPAQAGIMLYGGLLFGLLLALTRPLRRLPIGRLGRFALDLFITLGFAASLALSLLFATGGDPRAYALLFFGLGALVSRLSFSRLFTAILNIIRK